MEDPAMQPEYIRTRRTLLLDAHHKDESGRLESGTGLISLCVSAGDYKFLIEHRNDGALLPQVQNKMTNSILEAAHARCIITGSDGALHDVATNRLPVEIRSCATMSLIGRYLAEAKAATTSGVADSSLDFEVKLRRISIDDCYPDDERIIAGQKIVKSCRINEDILGLCFMIEEKRYPYKVLVDAGNALFDLCVKKGEYQVLSNIRPEMLPFELRLVLEEKIEMARKRAEEMPDTGSKRYVQDIKLDYRLLGTQPRRDGSADTIESDRLVARDAWTPAVVFRKSGTTSVPAPPKNQIPTIPPPMNPKLPTR